MPEEEAFAVLLKLMNEYRLRELYRLVRGVWRVSERKGIKLISSLEINSFSKLFLFRFLILIRINIILNQEF